VASSAQRGKNLKKKNVAEKKRKSSTTTTAINIDLFYIQFTGDVERRVNSFSSPFLIHFCFGFFVFKKGNTLNIFAKTMAK
jgi:hypothetical protein